MRFASAIVLVGLLFQDPSPPETPDPKKAERLKRAMEMFRDSDRELHESGKSELLALGASALPAIEEELQKKGILDLAKLYREVSRAGAASAENYVSTEDLQRDLAAVKDLPKMDRASIEKFVQYKYHEAAAVANKGRYEQGYEMARALLTLEPHSVSAENLKRLRRYCENMVTQTSLLEAKIFQDKPSYLAGEKVELTLRLRNVFKNTLMIRYDVPGASNPAPGMTVIETEISQTGIQAETITGNRHLELSHEGEIPIAPGGQWERRFTLDTDAEFANKADVEMITVNAWSQPLKIETEGASFMRRLQYEPTVVKVVPKKFQHLMADPLGELTKQVEKGTEPELYVCAQLLEGKQRDQGIEILIRAMEKTENPPYRTTLSWVLFRMTGERFGSDPKKWLEWLSSRGKKTK
jgi:hypothetical protein